MVFSIDSVLTAIGLVQPDTYQSAPFPMTSVPWVPLVIMTAGILAGIVVMLAFIEPIARFIKQYPALKMRALSFLMMIGMLLAVEGVGVHVPRGYIYFEMGFSLFVELLISGCEKTRRRVAISEWIRRGASLSCPQLASP